MKLSAKLFLFSSNPKNSSYFIHNIIHRSSIQHWMKKGWNTHFSNKWFKSFYQYECSISKKYFFWNHLCINIVVERVPCCVWTSNGLALTMLTVPHYWFIENQSRFTNESRNAMVLAYNFLIYSEVIREIMHLFFPSSKGKSTAGWIQPILEINNSHTLPFQKRSIHQVLHLDLLDLLLKYRY